MGNLPTGEIGEAYPGQPGLVLARGRTGAPTLTAMTWGFPYSATGKQGEKLKPRPVNNARAGSEADPRGHPPEWGCGTPW